MASRRRTWYKGKIEGGMRNKGGSHTAGEVRTRKKWPLAMRRSQKITPRPHMEPRSRQLHHQRHRRLRNLQELRWHEPPLATRPHNQKAPIRTSRRRLSITTYRERRVPHGRPLPRHVLPARIRLQDQNSRQCKGDNGQPQQHLSRVRPLGNVYVRRRKALRQQGSTGSVQQMGNKNTCCPAYSPWVNGLVEGTNKLFLHILKRLCAPNLDNEDVERTSTDDIPKSWPDHFEETIRILNWRLLPALKFSPKELMLGLVINTKPTNIDTSTVPVTEFDVALQLAYMAQQRLDGYAEAVTHALKRKNTFDKRVLARKPGEVTFSKGQLVQIYRSDLDHTYKMERKLLPKWSTPQRITARHLNSYTLENLNGEPLTGSFSARRLRRFIPQEGTRLAEEQKLIEERCAIEEAEARSMEAEEIISERKAEDQQPPAQQDDPFQDTTADG